MAQPKAKSLEQAKELEKLDEGFKGFNSAVKDLTLDKLNEAPKLEEEQQTKKSTRELQNADAPYLKPKRSLGAPEKFNERFRSLYNHLKEYVCFVAENKEIIGESIPLWTKPIGGMPMEEWEVPVNKPVWGPRYLAEQLTRCSYHRIIMDDTKPAYGVGVGTMTGAPTIDKTINRVDAYPVSQKRTVFMGGKDF